METVWEVLVTEGDSVKYLIEFEGNDFQISASFIVFEVVSWEVDSNAPSDVEKYLKGYVKWDGCSHFWFGDDDGYMHLCGREDFDRIKASLIGIRVW